MAASSPGLRVRWSTPVFKSVYTYKCKRTIIRLHCATSKSSLWNMEYVARGSTFEHPCIYCTSIHVHDPVNKLAKCTCCCWKIVGGKRMCVTFT